MATEGVQQSSGWRSSRRRSGRREEIEKTRRLPRDLVEALRRTGLFGLSVPRAIGGDEAHPRDILRAIEVVEGRWPFASGSTHAEWLWGGCMVIRLRRPGPWAAAREDPARIRRFSQRRKVRIR